MKSKRTLRKRGECAAALSGGFRTSPQVANVRKCALLGHSRRTKAPPRNATLVPKRAFSAGSPYARGRMRLRLIFFQRLCARAPPAALRYAVAPDALRAPFSRASLSTFADTAKHIRNTEQTRKICRADFFSQRNAVKKISPGARRFCLYSSNRFIRGAKPRPGGRGLMLIRERGYLCRLAVI